MAVTAAQILEDATTVLVVDWPSRDVPDTLARAGYTVVDKGGPEPDNYNAYELVDDEVVARRVGRPPEHAEIVYTHRPVEELPEIIAVANAVSAAVVWRQSGLASDGTLDPHGSWSPEGESRFARELVESSGLDYLDDVYIADAVRGLRASE
jgi:predicted CoA-binding protein